MNHSVAKHLEIRMSLVPIAWIHSLSLVIAAVSLASCHMRNESIIVPEGFSGLGVIVYGMDTGQALQVDAGKTVIEMPENGVFVTSDKIQEGYGWTNFFYRERETGSLISLPDGTMSEDVNQWPSVFCRGYSTIVLEENGESNTYAIELFVVFQDDDGNCYDIESTQFQVMYDIFPNMTSGPY